MAKTVRCNEVLSYQGLFSYILLLMGPGKSLVIYQGLCSLGVCLIEVALYNAYLNFKLLKKYVHIADQYTAMYCTMAW